MNKKEKFSYTFTVAKWTKAGTLSTRSVKIITTSWQKACETIEKRHPNAYDTAISSTNDPNAPY